MKDNYEAFLAKQLEVRGITERQLYLDRQVVRCDCGEDNCNGWIAVPKDMEDFAIEMMTGLTPEEFRRPHFGREALGRCEVVVGDPHEMTWPLFGGVEAMLSFETYCDLPSVAMRDHKERCAWHWLNDSVAPVPQEARERIGKTYGL